MAAMSVGGFAWAQSASTQSTQPTSQTAPPKAVPKKAPSKPIDPDETAGMRGSGSPLTVRVLVKGKTVDNAHVVVKNTNGTVAGSCFTSAAGDCKVDVGPDDYEIDATGNGRTGTLKLHVSAETRTVSIKLLKAKSAAPAAKP
jgi:uncharacterized protein with FMN-binding domain